MSTEPKCCRQRTYRIAKSFKYNTYKKQGEGGVMVNQHPMKDGGAELDSPTSQRRIVEKLPAAASGRSCVTLPDLARTTAYAFLASVPVCSGASKSIPWHAHSNSIAIVCRKLTSMRSRRRAPLIPMET